tara:strand:+ start:1521 stop:1799 length:279 start_codon:yes stop_codon:yes gene_type:complete
MEFKTKSGVKVKFKEISVLELCKLKDVLHNSTDFNSEDNRYTAPFECMYRWLKVGVEGFTDEFFTSLGDDERAEIFVELQKYYIMGEQKASK